MSSFTTTICDRCTGEPQRGLPGGVVHWELKEDSVFGSSIHLRMHVADICTKCGHEAFGAPEPGSEFSRHPRALPHHRGPDALRVHLRPGTTSRGSHGGI